LLGWKCGVTFTEKSKKTSNPSSQEGNQNPKVGDQLNPSQNQEKINQPSQGAKLSEKGWDVKDGGRWVRAFLVPNPVFDTTNKSQTYEEFCAFCEEQRKKGDEDFDLAKQKCPRLYVDPKLFALERAVLARNLGIDGIPTSGIIGYREGLRSRDYERSVEAIFSLFWLSYSGIDEKGGLLARSKNYAGRDDKGAYLWLLSHLQQILKKINDERKGLEKSQQDSCWRNVDAKRLNLLRYMGDKLSELDTTELTIREYVKSLFLEIFPTECSPTCVVKYNVLRHSKDDNLRCIQYFFYWPIQILPHHFFDYEPVYVYVYKLKDGRYTTLLVLFNGVPSVWATLKTLLSFFRKRPGHLIRMFFNRSIDFFAGKSLEYLDREIPFWNLEDPKECDDYWAMRQANPEEFEDHGAEAPYFSFDDYYELGRFMTKAYSGQYVYEKKPRVFGECAVRRLIDGDRYLALCIPKVLGFPVWWHAFDKCSPEIMAKKDWVVNCDLIPLDHRDLLHIEWNIYQPFQAPFLYPLIGGKDPLMHYPLDALDLARFYSRVRIWREFRDDQWDERARKYEVSELVNIYRLGKLIEFLCVQQGKNQEIKNLWKEIEDFERAANWARVKAGSTDGQGEMPS